jgi:hypothetical protein
MNPQVLRRLLHERYEDYVSKTGGRGSPSEAAASQAVAAAFSHAAALNAHALVAGMVLAAHLALVPHR